MNPSKFVIILILNMIICVTYIVGAPVDVNNDDRPIVGVISANEEQPIVGKEESSNLEIEYIPSKALTVYDNSQQKYANTFQQNAKPIVDTIQEHEKYGNYGDKFGAGRALVNTFESFANVVNKIIEAPKAFARSISHSFTEKLNQIGVRLVGL